MGSYLQSLLLIIWFFRFSNVSYQVTSRDFEASKDPAEWAFVERLLPSELHPKIPDLKEYPSGFVPAKLKPGEIVINKCKVPLRTVVKLN
jgi:hypothetical protein